MYKIIICISNHRLLSEINSFVYDIMERYRIRHKILTFSSEKSILKAAENNLETDVIIIDVNLQDANGVETIKKLRKLGNKSNVIYLSDDKSHAYDAIATDVFRYILKSDCKEALAKSIILDYKRNYQTKYTLIKVGGLLKKIQISDVLYLETCNRGTNIYYNDELIYVSIKLSSFIETLPQNVFYRCHFSFAVNIRKVVGIKRYEAVLENGNSVPISKTHYDEVKKAFIDNIS